MTYYERKLKQMIEKNKKYIKEFEKSMKKSGLSDKTIKKHIDNVDFYLDTFLTYYEITEMPKGCFMIDEFLGDWFIRKCMWSTAYSTKTTAASIKKFYKCMYELGYVKKDSYDYLCETIKNNLKEWMDKVERYNSIDEDWYYGE